jgi:predicted short-subunit dehydrogenase-like oxidoreductase (DUF2520 family)
MTAIAVVGAGRVGLTLARALSRSGHRVAVLGRSARRLPHDLGAVETAWRAPLGSSEVVILAVPDDALAATVAAVAATHALEAKQVVLHTSGRHGAAMLAPLAARGTAVAAAHPLQSFPDPDGSDPAILADVPLVVTGDAVAIDAARRLAAELAMGEVVELPEAGRVAYHAAAAIASNYLVVLADLAGRLASSAGAGEGAERLFVPILRQTLRHLEARGAANALTGPVRRGDVETVVAHLGVLSGDDRAAYAILGRLATDLALRAGLDPAVAAALRPALD